MKRFFNPYNRYRLSLFLDKVKSLLLGKITILKKLESIPANSNPFHYDHCRMGTHLVRGWMVLHDGFDSKQNPLPLDYIILVNQRTGTRFRLELPQE